MHSIRFVGRLRSSWLGRSSTDGVVGLRPTPVSVLDGVVGLRPMPVSVTSTRSGFRCRAITCGRRHRPVRFVSGSSAVLVARSFVDGWSGRATAYAGLRFGWSGRATAYAGLRDVDTIRVPMPRDHVRDHVRSTSSVSPTSLDDSVHWSKRHGRRPCADEGISYRNASAYRGATVCIQ